MKSVGNFLLVLIVLLSSPEPFSPQEFPNSKPDTLAPQEQPHEPAPAAQHDQAGLAGVRTIFVMPMKNRLEHFLTHELVKWGRFDITVNPQQADAVMSDTTELDIKQLMSRDAKIRKTLARTRGTAFLIDLKTEKVVWAVAKKPSESFFLGGEKSTQELAKEIVGQLKRDLERPSR